MSPVKQGSRRRDANDAHQLRQLEGAVVDLLDRRGPCRVNRNTDLRTVLF